MTVTLAIRISEADRDVLTAAAKAQGQAVGSFVRELAEAEARRLRAAAMRSQAETAWAAMRDDLNPTEISDDTNGLFP